MITSLTKQQLAFILDIKAEEARAKMCVAYAKFKGEENKAEFDHKGKCKDPYPKDIAISILSEHLNLPTLQDSVNDIEANYLNRPASKKWILCDYPEKELKSREKAGKPRRVAIPAALKSMLPEKTQQIIKLEWQKRFNKIIV